MREIKFRAKRADNGDWVYGCYCRCIEAVGMKKSKLAIQETDENGLYFREIDLNTLGQFTGHCDKNGKEIYENDIVEGTVTSAWAKQKIRCKVIYERDRFICIDNDNNIHKVMFGKDIVVIGNVYDNPKLLKGE